MTFDEWFKSQHNGVSFDETYLHGKGQISDYFMALSRELRAYVSEVVNGRA